MNWISPFRRPTAGRQRVVSVDGGLSIKGDLRGSEDLVIEARVVGAVVAPNVSIGPHAVVDGSVRGRRVVVSGQVHGEIRAAHVRLDPGSIVHGRIEHVSLTVAPTADFQGQSIRRADPVAAAEPAQTVRPAGAMAKVACA